MNSIKFWRGLLVVAGALSWGGGALAQGHYFTVIHQFAGGAGDGATPDGSLLLSGSTLYGMTSSGGTNNQGTIFRLDTDGTGFALVHAFAGGPADGGAPHGSLILSGSTLYGMTTTGGAYGFGCVFSVNTDGSGFTLLHSFAGGSSDGTSPYGSLLQIGSTLYGMTNGGGDFGVGLVFGINTDGSGFTVLHALDGANDGAKPFGSLVVSGRTLFGMTSGGGQIGGQSRDANLGITGNVYGDAGTVFSVNTDGSNFKVLYYFNLNATSNQSGYAPRGTLALLPGSKVIGLTSKGGPPPAGLESNAQGTAFTLGFGGSGYTVVHAFGGLVTQPYLSNDGTTPEGALSPSGYGTTSAGGLGSKGTIFGENGAQLLYSFTGGSDGGVPTGDILEVGSMIYGMTSAGGANGLGVIFAVNPDGPMVTTQPSNQTVVPGGSTTFTVAANGSSLTYQWQRMAAGTSTWGDLPEGGAFTGTMTATLSVNPVTLAMNGDSFRCIVTNGLGSDTSAAAVLTVTNAVYIAAPPSNQSVAAGGSATFSVTATGAAPITYQWQREPAGTSAWTNLTDGGSFGGTATATLTVNPATSAMNGDSFQCVVSNASSSATTTTAVLTVTAAVTFAAEPADQTATVGGSATLTVTATGVPTLAYQWQREAAGATAWTNLSDGTNYSGSSSATLTIRSLSTAMSGDQFQCVVSNSYGSATSKPATLTVLVPLTVTTLAGTSGHSGAADGTGTAALFFSPADAAIDSAGNLYVADTYNHTIRKVTPAGAVTTLAGSAGNSGSTDGTGAAARFNHPTGLTVDSAGNVYVADTDNDTIRQITAAGVVTTIAGQAGLRGSTDGAATTALFNSPSGIAMDTAGNLYVADTLNHSLRMITSGGTVSTIAGAAGAAGAADGTGTAARFYGPQGLATDGRGNLYVADTNNQTIRKVVFSTGTVTTVAGLAGNSGTADGQGTAARFHNPSAVAIDRTGTLWIADTDNHTVREVSSAGVVATVAGAAGVSGSVDGFGTAARFNFPSGIAADGSGNIYVVDTDNDTVRAAYVPTAPGITTQPVGQVVAAGSNVAFAVTASGRPAPSYQWYFNGTAIQGATSTTFSLTNVQAADAGDYSVVATNVLGSATSNRATLSLLTPATGGGTAGGKSGGGAVAAWFVLALALVGWVGQKARSRRS